jgi:hypothetical protein
MIRKLVLLTLILSTSFPAHPNESVFYKWKTFVYLNFETLKRDSYKNVQQGSEIEALKDLLCNDKSSADCPIEILIHKSQTRQELVNAIDDWSIKDSNFNLK